MSTIAACISFYIFQIWFVSVTAACAWQWTTVIAQSYSDESQYLWTVSAWAVRITDFVFPLCPTKPVFLRLIPRQRCTAYWDSFMLSSMSWRRGITDRTANILWAGDINNGQYGRIMYVSYDMSLLLRLMAASVVGGVVNINVITTRSSNLQLSNAIGDVIDCRCADLSPLTH